MLIHSRAQGVLRHSQINMNHAFEFGDVDVDSDSEAVLEHCELVATSTAASSTVSWRCSSAPPDAAPLRGALRGELLRDRHRSAARRHAPRQSLHHPRLQRQRGAPPRRRIMARLEHSRVSRVGARARKREAEEKEKRESRKEASILYYFHTENLTFF